MGIIGKLPIHMELGGQYPPYIVYIQAFTQLIINWLGVSEKWTDVPKGD